MKPLAVYVHIPFCTVKCGYCDFNAYAGMDNLKDAYASALLDEVRSYAGLLTGREVSSIGIGGGTPGEVPAAHITAVIEAIRRTANLVEDAEVSLETNPGTTGRGALHELRAAGVNRLSLGAQSFHTEELRFLDRIHSPEATAAAFALAREAGFQSIGLDLIYGLPDQTLGRWLDSLRQAIALQPDHISTYALTVEEGTPLARRVAMGEVTVPDGDALADLYESATAELRSAGFEQYEISNWCRPGRQSRHNRVYWTNGEYLGIGAGAHGYIAGERFENIAHPRAYISEMEGSRAEGRGLANRYVPDRVSAMSDWLVGRLRLLEGFEAAEFEHTFGETLDSLAGPVLEECVAAGVLAIQPRVRLTERGRLLHGEICARLLAHLGRHDHAAGSP